MKKLMAILLAAVLCLTALAACTKSSPSDGTEKTAAETGKETEKAEETGTETAEPADDGRRDLGGLKLPLTEEKKELSVWIMFNGDPATDLGQIESVKKMEEATNVHINWTPIGMDEFNEKFGTMIASGDYPDILFCGQVPYPGGTEKGIEDGVLIDNMDELIHSSMPNYMALLNSSEEARRQATSDNGKLLNGWTILCYGDEIRGQGNYTGMAYRKDILEKLGMEEPKTIDGWHEVFKAAKEAGLVEYGLNLSTNGGCDFSYTYGVKTISGGDLGYLMLEDGKVVFGPHKDSFKDYLDTMKQWYSEGLINPNFTSFNFYLDTPGSVETDQCMMYSWVVSNFTGKSYYNMHMITNENAYLEPILGAVLKEGDPTCMAFDHIVAKDRFFITTGCKDPVLAAQWLDYGFTREAAMYNWFGIEGETYEMVDGQPQYLDSLFNQEGKAPRDILKNYALNMSTWLGLNDFNSELRMNEKISQGTDYNLMAQNKWDSADINYALPKVTLTADEGAAANRKMTDLNTLVEEYMVKYITGQQVDDFETFKKNLESFGMDEVVSIYQDALDRYMAR